MSRGGLRPSSLFADMVEDKKMVDFTKTLKPSDAVIGEMITLPRGLPDEIIHNNQRFIKTGVIEKDLTKFDNDFWGTKVFDVLSANAYACAVGATKYGAGCVAFGNGLFIIGLDATSGIGSAPGVIKYSTDLKTFNTKSLGVAVDMASAVFYNDRFLVVTNTGRCYSLTWDGTTLGEITEVPNFYTVSAGAAISHIENIDGVLWAVGAGGKAYKSTDGINWTVVSVSSTYLYAISYVGPVGAKKYIISSTEGLYTSADGVTWDFVARTSSTLNFKLQWVVTYFDGTYFYGGYKSTDATTWVADANVAGVTGCYVNKIGNHYILAGYNLFKYSFDRLSWIIPVNMAASPNSLSSLAIDPVSKTIVMVTHDASNPTGYAYFNFGLHAGSPVTVSPYSATVNYVRVS